MEGHERKARRDDVRREVWRVQGISGRKDRKKGKASAKKQGEIGETLERHMRGVNRRDRNNNLFAPPNGLRKIAETAIWCRRPGLARKKNEMPGTWHQGMPVAGRRRQ